MISAYVGFFRQLHLRHSLFFPIMENIKSNPQPDIKVFIFHDVHLTIYYILISIINRQRKVCQIQSNLLHLKLKCGIMQIYCLHLHLIYLLFNKEIYDQKTVKITNFASFAHQNVSFTQEVFIGNAF